jgi:hypothetical protein
MIAITGKRVSAGDALQLALAYQGVRTDLDHTTVRWLCGNGEMVTVEGGIGMVCRSEPWGKDEELEESILSHDSFPQTVTGRLEKSWIHYLGRLPRLTEVGSLVDEWLNASERWDDALGVREEGFGDVCALVGRCLEVEYDGVWATDPACAKRVSCIWVPQGVIRVGVIVMKTLGFDRPSGTPLSGAILVNSVIEALNCVGM